MALDLTYHDIPLAFQRKLERSIRFSRCRIQGGNGCAIKAVGRSGTMKPMSDAINWDVFAAALAALVAHDVIVLIGKALEPYMPVVLF